MNPTIKRERLGGILLIAAAAAALILANSPVAELYRSVQSLDAIKELAIFTFFLSVGIELRHEVRHGILRQPSTAIVPILSAIGGMALPVLAFSAINHALPTSAAWGVPMSTDIAFALAVFALAGRGLPKSLRTFVMSIAVADDSFTILIIAVFFTSNFSPISLISLAGVVLGLFVPGLGRSSSWLSPTVAYVALPVFAFYAAGVSMHQLEFGNASAVPLVAGIMVGQLLAKPIGVLGTAWLVTKSRLGKLPAGIKWADLRSVAWLFGMCFTISMLMVELTFGANHQNQSLSVISVLVATTISGLLAATAMRLRARQIERLG